MPSPATPKVETPSLVELLQRSNTLANATLSNVGSASPAASNDPSSDFALATLSTLFGSDLPVLGNTGGLTQDPSRDPTLEELSAILGDALDLIENAQMDGLFGAPAGGPSESTMLVISNSNRPTQ